MKVDVRSGFPWSWMLATILAQTAWGAYPVLARYLQAVTGLPSMSVVGLANLLALGIVALVFFRKVNLKDFRVPGLAFFAIIVIGRGLTNFLAARYTLAIYVQLITQLTPFIVAGLSLVVLHEKLPPFTGRALLLSLFGAGLMIGNDLFGAGQSNPFRQDLLGISLAALSSILLAIYMIAVRRSARTNIRGETLLLVQLFSLGLSGCLISLLVGEDWAAWGTMQGVDWLIFGVLVVGVFAGANTAQIGAIRHLGASLVSSTMAWRLVSALVLAALLLGERLASITQLLGAAIVLVTITWYLWKQRGPIEFQTSGG